MHDNVSGFMTTHQDRARGMLVGLAVGDALGAPYEFGYFSNDIESLYEDIYRNEFGKTEKKIGPMISKIGKKFQLEDKVIRIKNDNFYFSKEMKKIFPFKYKKRDKNDFYSTYNSLKHNRSKNIRKANISMLLRTLAAFYILCVIFDDRWMPLKNSIVGEKTPYTYSYNTVAFSADVYDKQLAYFQQSIIFLAMKIDSKKNNKKSCINDLMAQCEENLQIRFRSQHPSACLFIAQLTPEYMKKLDAFQEKYSNDNAATEIELGLIFGNHDDKKHSKSSISII